MENYDVIIKNEFGVEAKLEEGNVWLCQKDIEHLFGSSHSNVSEHIKNIFLSKEQDENSVCRFFRHTGPDGKNYNIKYYNKEMVMSIGFKINSEIAIEFRKWAIEVINSGLSNKYAPPCNCIECVPLLQTIQMVQENTRRINKIEMFKEHELTFQKGEQFEGYLSIKKFLETAKQSIYIIDDYFDNSFDEVLKKINVSTTIITDPNNKIESNEIYIVKKTKAFHDRFIFADGVGYHLGCSLKDIGNSLAIATRLESIKLSDLLKLIK